MASGSLDFPGGSDGKASAYNLGDLGSIPGLERSSGEGNGNTLQYSCLENSMDGEVCWSTVHEVTKSQTRLNNFTSLHTTQYQKNKQPNQKVGKRPKLTFLQTYRWLTNTWKVAQHHSLLEKCSKLQWDITSHGSEWPTSKSLQTINTGEGVEKREPSCIVGGNVNWYSPYGRWMEIP